MIVGRAGELRVLDRLAVCVAALGVLRAAAARRPVLAVVDDIQWADSASRESIEYIARRAGGRLAVVLAARDPWDGVERMRLPTLAIGPVDDRSAIGLLRAAAPDLAVAVASMVTVAAAGNPLALVELPATLTPAQRSGLATVEEPLAPGRRSQHAFAGRIEALAMRLAEDLDGLGSDWPWIHLLLRTQVAVGAFEPAQGAGLALAERAYEAGALATLSGALLVAADSAFRLGDWRAADTGTLQAVEVGREAGQPALRGYALATRARLLAPRARRRRAATRHWWRSRSRTRTGSVAACGSFTPLKGSWS